MDGAWSVDVQWTDDNMRSMRPVSMSRGRVAEPETFPSTAFTQKQLNDVAPLSKADTLSLQTQNHPSKHAKMMVAWRIQVARSLKYPKGI